MQDMDKLGLKGLRALVTGGGSGIGRATAELLHSLGATVAAADLAPPASSTPAIAGYRIDICDEEKVKQCFEAVQADLGGLDIVVNCAGIMEKIVSTRKQGLPDWQHVMRTNLEGSFIVAREAARNLKAEGAIVLVSSVAGIAGMRASNAYGVSKAGVNMLTKTLACDLARFGVRVNTVAPGFTATPMTDALSGNAGMDQTAFTGRTPMGRLAAPSEIAWAIAFLASPAASFITGTVLPVDGGWTAFGGIGQASQ